MFSTILQAVSNTYEAEFCSRTGHFATTIFLRPFRSLFRFAQREFRQSNPTLGAFFHSVCPIRLDPTVGLRINSLFDNQVSSDAIVGGKPWGQH